MEEDKSVKLKYEDWIDEERLKISKGCTKFTD